ncbi:MAG: NAD(+) synthase [Microthrixaceae bacterium]
MRDDDGPAAATDVAAFHSPYRHGFVRLAAAVPTVAVTEVEGNTDATIELIRRAHHEHVAVAVFPELGLTGYSAQDLFHQTPLLRAAEGGLERIRLATRELLPLVVVGVPLRVGHQLFNTAIVLHRGRVLGAVPKSYLPNYREFYEQRHFSAARAATVDVAEVLGTEVPFGTDLLFRSSDVADLVVGVEICEDLWSPIPPSSRLALAGATVLVNPSGSNITIGKDDYRRALCTTHSAQTLSSYVYAAAGIGESTTDLAWDGHALVCENGNVLAESERYANHSQLVTADVDLDRLVADRIRTTSFRDTIVDHRDTLAVRTVGWTLDPPSVPTELRRRVSRFPFVPADPVERDRRCAEVYAIQTNGLATRLRATGIDKVVLGVSGGLDSTQALLVAVRCMDLLGLPRTNVLGYTLPGFATSDRTRTNAHLLMEALGVSAAEIDIRPAAQQMLEDLDHPAARGEPVYDVTYENVQAGARTSVLFRLANQHDALVIGTGDLSELALGWCTYGVGDQMSHYGVNGSVPKTLIQYLVRWVAEHQSFAPAAKAVLGSILGTAISPELVPTTPGEDDASGGASGDAVAGPHQRSEDVVGPYELQDFHLYHVLRFGYPPAKIAYLAQHAWGDRDRGDWPDTIPEPERREYDLATACRWQRELLRRFFGTSQFKRSAMPDGPKVGSGGSLSPRGDWRAPSDGSAAVWLAELDGLVERLGLA